MHQAQKVHIVRPHVVITEQQQYITLFLCAWGFTLPVSHRHTCFCRSIRAVTEAVKHWPGTTALKHAERLNCLR